MPARSPSSSAGASVWAFLVVSDPGQADTLADQQTWAHDAAAQQKWVITKTISGVSSGKFGARRLTLGMIDELEAMSPSQRPKRLLMIRLERLGRGNGLEAMEAFLRIRRLGIIVHTRLDGDVGYDRASELLMPVLRFFIGGMENEVRRDKVNAVYERRRKARELDPTIAISSKPPYGLRIVDGRLMAKPPEDAAVRLAYAMKIQGYGSHLIAKRLAHVAPPWTLKSGAELPQHWTSDRVRRLIIKPTYRGTLVDEETWFRAQRPAREIRRPTMRHEYPLGGALRCECGYALVGHAGPGRHHKATWRYYQCRNLAAHGSMKHHRTDRIEAQFARLLKCLSAEQALLERYISGRRLDEGVNAASAQVGALKGELSKLDKRRRQIFAAYEDGALARSDLQWRLDDLKSGQSEQEAHLAALEREVLAARIRRTSAKELGRLVGTAASHWASAAIDDKRALAKAISNAFGGLIVTLSGELRVLVASELDRKRGRTQIKHERALEGNAASVGIDGRAVR